MSRLQLHRLNALLWGVIIAWLLAGCGEEPRPPRLVSFTPVTLAVPANETLAVSVEYEENDFALNYFQWRADAGVIEGNGAPSISYHAPERPGDYQITVTTHYGDDATELRLAAVVKVTEPSATEPPTAAAPPEAGWPPRPAKRPSSQPRLPSRRTPPNHERQTQSRASPAQRNRRAPRPPQQRPSSRSRRACLRPRPPPAPIGQSSGRGRR